MNNEYTDLCESKANTQPGPYLLSGMMPADRVTLLVSLMDMGMVTGSRRWNVHTEESDLDIVVRKCDWDYLCSTFHLIEGGDYWKGGSGGNEETPETFDSFCLCLGMSVNVIVVTNEGYAMWGFATRMTDKLAMPATDTIRNKKTRVEMFEHYKKEWIHENSETSVPQVKGQ
jgi:hypothetical protein